MGWSEGKRRLYLRDPERIIDVATGHGFMKPNGEPIEDFELPDDPSKFYSELQRRFKKTKASPTPRKGVKKKKRV
jgi:hypothetical protein